MLDRYRRIRGHVRPSVREGFNVIMGLVASSSFLVWAANKVASEHYIEWLDRIPWWVFLIVFMLLAFHVLMGAMARKQEEIERKCDTLESELGASKLSNSRSSGIRLRLEQLARDVRSIDWSNAPDDEKGKKLDRARLRLEAQQVRFIGLVIESIGLGVYQWPLDDVPDVMHPMTGWVQLAHHFESERPRTTIPMSSVFDLREQISPNSWSATITPENFDLSREHSASVIDRVIAEIGKNEKQEEQH